jgi:xanthine/uracil/vitamin C permease (AzgA family)
MARNRTDTSPQRKAQHGMLILIGLFLLLMGDFYVPAISGAPFPVVGVGLIWLSSQTFHRARRLEAVFAALLLLGIVVGLVGVFADPSIEIWPTNLVGWSFGFLLLLTNLQDKKAEIKRSLYILLAAHVGFFYLQAVVYSLSGYYIDPVSWLTGKESRYLAEGLSLWFRRGLSVRKFIHCKPGLGLPQAGIARF